MQSNSLQQVRLCKPEFGKQLNTAKHAAGHLPPPLPPNSDENASTHELQNRMRCGSLVKQMLLPVCAHTNNISLATSVYPKLHANAADGSQTSIVFGPGKSHRERAPPPSRSYRLPSRNARDYPQVVCFSQCASVTVWVVQKFSRKLCRAPVLRAGQAVWVGRGRRRMRSNKRARTHTHSR